MPNVRKHQLTSVQRRVVLIQDVSSFPDIRAAIAKANGRLSDMYPRYRHGGWITMYAFCRRGLRPWPSAGACASTLKGLVAKLRTTVKKTRTLIRMDTVNGINSRLRCRFCT